MPKGNAIKSPKQFRLMEAVMHGGLKGKGPSAGVAGKLLAETSHAKKSKFAKAKRPGKRAAALAAMQVK